MSGHGKEKKGEDKHGGHGSGSGDDDIYFHDPDKEGHGHGDEHGGGHEDGGHGGNHGKGHGEHKADGEGGGGKPAPKARRKVSSAGDFELLTLVLLAVFGRVMLKQFPALVSIEPIIPLAVYAGMLYGSDAGILVGLLGYPLSNIFLPGGPFGLYSVLQGIGGGLAGGIASYSKKADVNSLVYYSVIGTVIFEVAVNLPDQLLLVWPFSFIHIVSNVFIALLIGELSLKEK